MAGTRGGPSHLGELQLPDESGTGAVFPLVYAELRRLARHYLAHERPGHTLQATALVHEVYLRLVPQPDATWEDRGRLIGIAAHIMREVLVEHARSRHRQKRGGGAAPIPLDEDMTVTDVDCARWEDLDESLNRLAALDARQAKVVELRYFGGLTVDETAQVLAVSPKTVKRDWAVARAWLRRELED